MEKTMKKLLGIALLTMVSLGAYADDEPTAQSSTVTVDVNQFVGGTVDVSSQTPGAESDDVNVTITVKPATDYYIAKGDVVVVLTRAGVRKANENVENPKIAEPLVLTGDDPEDLTAVRTYTFTVPQGFGALVYKANFHPVVTSGTIGEKEESVNWEFTRSSVTVGEGEEAQTVDVLTLTFDGAAAIPAIAEGASAPWEMLKAKVTNVVIGKGITAIGANLFKDFASLKSIEIQNDEQVIALGEGAIPANEGQTVTIDVPGNLYNEYKVTEGWKTLTIDSKNAVLMTGVEFGTANNYDTYASAVAVKVPSVLNALLVTDIDNNTLVVEKVKDGIIPAGEAVLLLSKEQKGDDFRTSLAPAPAAAKSKENVPTQNLLKVAPEGGKEVKVGEVYLLYNDVFYFSQTCTIAEGGIYLTIPEPKPDNQPTKARLSYALRIGDAAAGTTGISTVSTSVAAPVWYGIDGRRHEGKPTRKGIYIIRGKKVVIK